MWRKKRKRRIATRELQTRNEENITIFPRFFNERRKRKTEGKRLTHNFQIISFVILSFDLKKIFPCFFQEEREGESF